jgi:hypothetical protein
VTAIIASAITPAAVPPAPTIRAIVLNPARYLDQKVTITGQYSGRNLLGDQPDAPAKSRYDFVLRSADAALWVVNMRPKMKDASGKDYRARARRAHRYQPLADDSRHGTAGARAAVARRRRRQPRAREAADGNDRRESRFACPRGRRRR